KHTQRYFQAECFGWSHDSPSRHQTKADRAPRFPTMSDLRSSTCCVNQCPPLSTQPLAVRTSPRGWRRTKCILERAGECGFGVVADKFGNLCQGRISVAELLSRDLHAPTCEVVHGWHADQMNEAIGQRRTRQADLAAKVID